MSQNTGWMSKVVTKKTPPVIHAEGDYKALVKEFKWRAFKGLSALAENGSLIIENIQGFALNIEVKSGGKTVDIFCLADFNHASDVYRERMVVIMGDMCRAVGLEVLPNGCCPALDCDDIPALFTNKKIKVALIVGKNQYGESQNEVDIWYQGEPQKTKSKKKADIEQEEIEVESEQENNQPSGMDDMPPLTPIEDVVDDSDADMDDDIPF